MDYIVIGSGPAGVSSAWALVKQGLKVTMLDVGEELEADKADLRDKLANTSPQQWQTQDIETYTNARLSKKVDTISPFGSTFLFKDPTQAFPHLEGCSSIKLKPSFAKGGLSNGWGASILPYRLEDIQDWPAASQNLASHYQALREFMPMAGKDDDLAELFPMLDMGSNTALPLSTQAEALLKRLQKRKQQLNHTGIHYGRARQAVATQDCRQCSMCLYGCPYGTIFNTSQTLQKLQEHANFTYQKGIFVKKLLETGDSVELQYVDIQHKSERSLSAKHVYVACGVLPTTQLILNSLEHYNEPVRIKDSQHFFLPLLHSWQTPITPDTENTTSLVQLFLEILDQKKSTRTSHVQLYTYNNLYAVDMRKRFGAFAGLLKPLINTLSQRLIVAQGFLHSDHSPEIMASLKNDKNGPQLILEEKLNPETDNAIRHTQKKISSFAFQTGLLPLTPLLRKGEAGSSFHCGSSFPMSEQPQGIESDTLGRPAGLKRIFVVDASSLPSIPATTITLSVMANAHRIATESTKLNQQN